MRLTENIMRTIKNVDYEASLCRRIEDTNKILKTVKGLKTQFKKYSCGEELVFSTDP